uniref:Uncharacterized protein n=1 Tax=Spongospora subterranea TaxID=70186 RepID=A0A0H5RBY8_9EUKA|eukprot:CRZ11750.1 hypothetical protein [Spongospora subterranea]
MTIMALANIFYNVLHLFAALTVYAMLCAVNSMLIYTVRLVESHQHLWARTRSIFEIVVVSSIYICRAAFTSTASATIEDGHFIHPSPSSTLPQLPASPIFDNNSYNSPEQIKQRRFTSSMKAVQIDDDEWTTPLAANVAGYQAGWSDMW